MSVVGSCYQWIGEDSLLRSLGAFCSELQFV
jgi:hypothetical protein